MKRQLLPHPTDAALTLVPLGGKYGIGKFATVDAKHAVAVGQHNWHAAPDGKVIYAYTNVRKPDGKKTVMKMHRLIASLQGWEAPEVDHENGDGLDNRGRNLRPATHAQNQRNVGLRSDNQSGHKGVYFHKESGRWRAHINQDRKRKHLGYFDSAEDAAKAYDRAAEKLFGTFAKLNISPDAIPDDALDSLAVELGRLAADSLLK